MVPTNWLANSSPRITYADSSIWRLKLLNPIS